MLQLQEDFLQLPAGAFELAGSVTASYSNVMCLDYLSQSITGRACLYLEPSCCLKTSKAITGRGKQSKTLMACLKSTKEKEADLFNGDNEEDEREQRGNETARDLGDVLEFATYGFITRTAAVMRHGCFCFSKLSALSCHNPDMCSLQCDGAHPRKGNHLLIIHLLVQYTQCLC